MQWNQPRPLRGGVRLQLFQHYRAPLNMSLCGLACSPCLRFNFINILPASYNVAKQLHTSPLHTHTQTHTHTSFISKIRPLSEQYWKTAQRKSMRWNDEGVWMCGLRTWLKKTPYNVPLKAGQTMFLFMSRLTSICDLWEMEHTFSHIRWFKEGAACLERKSKPVLSQSI